MKGFIVNLFIRYKNLRQNEARAKTLSSIYEKYANFTMINKEIYIENLLLAEKVKLLKGDIIECGVWRGGMIAGISEIIGNSRSYFLFDSFEGLPDAKEIDGQAALDWQKNKGGYNYHNNCKAEIEFAQNAMMKTGVENKCIQGWFDQTVPIFNDSNEISLLRLDGDWYDSTKVCLVYLFPKVVKGGIIILDDYYTWDGCSRAVHDYLSDIKSTSRIFTSEKGVCYIIKTD